MTSMTSMTSRRVRIGIVGCLLTFVSVGIATAAAGGTALRHTVRRGQTLYSIARTYGVPMKGLAAANGIKNPGRLRAGARLVIPGKSHRPAIDVPAQLSPAMSPALPDPTVTTARLPWPVIGKVISGFDRPRRGHRHRGIDIASETGTPIRAVAGGVVARADEHFGNFGRLVVIEHDDGLFSWYGHNLKNLVKTGQRVSADEVIALVGRSGNASTDHLHFELRRGGEAFDPVTALAPRPSRSDHAAQR